MNAGGFSPRNIRKTGSTTASISMPACRRSKKRSAFSPFQRGFCATGSVPQSQYSRKSIPFARFIRLRARSVWTLGRILPGLFVLTPHSFRPRIFVCVFLKRWILTATSTQKTSAPQNRSLSIVQTAKRGRSCRNSPITASAMSGSMPIPSFRPMHLRRSFFTAKCRRPVRCAPPIRI